MARVCINEFIALHAKWENVRPKTDSNAEMKRRKYVCLCVLCVVRGVYVYV